MIHLLIFLNLIFRLYVNHTNLKLAFEKLLCRNDIYYIPTMLGIQTTVHLFRRFEWRKYHSTWEKEATCLSFHIYCIWQFLFLCKIRLRITASCIDVRWRSRHFKRKCTEDLFGFPRRFSYRAKLHCGWFHFYCWLFYTGFFNTTWGHGL